MEANKQRGVHVKQRPAAQTLQWNGRKHTHVGRRSRAVHTCHARMLHCGGRCSSAGSVWFWPPPARRAAGAQQQQQQHRCSQTGSQPANQLCSAAQRGPAWHSAAQRTRLVLLLYLLLLLRIKVLQCSCRGTQLVEPLVHNEVSRC